jgi:hypothetical protein
MERFFLTVGTFVAALFFLPSAYCTSLLWTKSITPASGASLAFSIGADGTVAIADAYRNTTQIFWYDRSGALLQTLLPKNANVYGFVYVSKDEVITMYRGADLEFRMELFQVIDQQLEQTTFASALNSVSSEYKFSYPYILVSKVTDGTYELKLYDLTSSIAPTVIGDAVIGIQGKNLQVRWKSLATAKYKTQTSTDLVTWTDYTDVLSGTGSTIVISIPLSETSGTLYARVVKL